MTCFVFLTIRSYANLVQNLILKSSSGIWVGVRVYGHIYPVQVGSLIMIFGKNWISKILTTPLQLC